MNNQSLLISLLNLRMTRIHKEFLESRRLSIIFRSKATRELKASSLSDYKLIMSMWSKEMHKTKKLKIELKEVCDSLRYILITSTKRMPR